MAKFKVSDEDYFPGKKTSPPSDENRAKTKDDSIIEKREAVKKETAQTDPVTNHSQEQELKNMEKTTTESSAKAYGTLNVIKRNPRKNHVTLLLTDEALNIVNEGAEKLGVSRNEYVNALIMQRGRID